MCFFHILFFFILVFLDFNFELDRYAVEILIKSGVSLVFAGAEVALNSMWLWKDDLEAIAKRVADNKNNQLITELSKEENYKTWLGVFQTMGTHLAPWNKDNNHTTNLNTINGYVCTRTRVMFYCLIFLISFKRLLTKKQMNYLFHIQIYTFWCYFWFSIMCK